MQGSNGNRHWCVRGPWRPRNGLAHWDNESRLEPFFKGKRLGAITRAIRDYIRQRQAEKAANGTINRELAALKRLFNLAIDGGTLRHNPKIPMLRESNARQGVFEREQFENVRAHLLPHFDPLSRSPT